MKPRPSLRITSRRRAIEAIAGAAEQGLRRAGRHRALVLDQLRRGDDPRPADLARALREPVHPPGPHEGVVLTVEELEQGVALDALAPERIAAGRERAWQCRLDEQAELAAYVAQAFVLGTPRKTGRPRGAATLQTSEILSAFAALVAQSPRLSRRQAHQRLAERFGCSIKSIERITQGYDRNF